MPRSPSHEAFAVKQLAMMAETLPEMVACAWPTNTRATSRPGSSCSVLLQIPHGGGSRRVSAASAKSGVVQERGLSDEQAQAIRSCGALSSAVLGLMKSFSTSDLLSCGNGDPLPNPTSLRPTVSELALFGGVLWNPNLELPNIRQLDATSRSCSTWVAVGDPVSISSQIPSPHGPAESVIGSTSAAITPLDLVLSVNKKVRQMYIRRRLLTTYRALERLSRSQLDLSKVIKGDLEFLANSPSSLSQIRGQGRSGLAGDARNADLNMPRTFGQQASVSNYSLGDTALVVPTASKVKLRVEMEKANEDGSALTVHDVELQKGKPLTKYERNIRTI